MFCKHLKIQKRFSHRGLRELRDKIIDKEKNITKNRKKEGGQVRRYSPWAGGLGTFAWSDIIDRISACQKAGGQKNRYEDLFFEFVACFIYENRQSLEAVKLQDKFGLLY